MHQYDIVDEFEQRIAIYAGARYGVAVDSCTNAIKLCLVYRRITDMKDDRVVKIPHRTYVGVAYSILNAGCRCSFHFQEWQGNYELRDFDGYESWGIIDSARRFHKDMAIRDWDSFRCLSFHETKHLPIGRGGMILTNSDDAYLSLRRMRFDGRTPGADAKYDNYVAPGYHCHMKPDDAARGLMLMAGMPDYNDDLPNSDYPDLSTYPIFQEGYKWM
jgi:dTDP-4-amino-4,6-dideoxygalactose transaminase